MHISGSATESEKVVTCILKENLYKKNKNNPNKTNEFQPIVEGLRTNIPER